MTVVFALGGFQVWTGDTLPLGVTPRASTGATPALAWPGSEPASMQVYMHDNVLLLAHADPTPDPHRAQLDHLVARRIDATLVVSWSQWPGAPLPMAWTLRIDADRPYLFQLAPQVQHVAIPLLVWPHTDHWRVTLSARTQPDQPRIPSRTLWFRWNPDVDYPESVRTQAMTLETPS